MFINLHNHSDHSVFDGFQTIEEMIERAKELKQTAIGLCDHGTTSGLYKFRNLCLKNNIHPVMGVELYFTTHNIKDKEDIYHIGVWAQSTQGLKNLYKLTTLAHQNTYYKPRLTFDMIKQYHEGVVFTSACCGGFLSNVDAFEWAQKFQTLLGDRFYIELFATDEDKIKEYNIHALSLAQVLGIKTIISTDAHYSTPSRTALHSKWKSCGDDNYFHGSTYYLMGEEDVLKFTDSIPKEVVLSSIQNTYELAMSCQVEIKTGERHYPSLGIDNPKETLLAKCREGFKKRGLTTLSPDDKKTYGERVTYEVSILEKAGYIDYILITANIIDFARENNVLCGIGRGSVVASLVAYLLGITHLDPIKYNLIFERFCHLERVTMPDVDNDLESLCREDIINYIRSKYGEVYQVRTINALGIRGAIQRAGQVLGKDPKKIDEYSKVFGDNIDKLPDLEVKNMAKQFSGYIQNYGVHASAIAVFPSDPNEWCAIERQDGNFVVAYDFHEIEEMGLLKIDMLGLKTLDIIHATLDSIPDNIDIYNLPDDKEVFDMLTRGETAGCFQIESKGMTDVVKRMKPTTVSNLFDVVALYRPGITDAGMLDPYLNKTAKSLHHTLDGILANTRNIIIYQEQIMQIAQKVAGYTLGEADMLRRGVGRKEEELVNSIGEDFLKKAVANGYSQLDAEHIWSNIKTFARYGFNLGHSAAYGYTAYITAYLKYHYPKHFFAAVLNQAKREDYADYISEMRRMKINIIPPQISEPICRATDEGVIIGLNLIKGVGKSLENFTIDKPESTWYNINKRSAEAMIKAGVWKGDRNLLLAQLEWVKDKHKKKIPFEEVVATTNFTDVEMEYDVLGFSFDAVLSVYDDSFCKKYKDCFLGTVTALKPYKTKTGKPMAFIKVTMGGVSKDFVCFEKEKCFGLNIGTTYVLKIDGTQIKDYMEAKRK